MTKIVPLVNELSKLLDWRPQRIELAAHFILALSACQNVNLTKVSQAMEGKSKAESNYRRLQRFFSQHEFSEEEITQLFPQLLELEDPWILCLDRTNWNANPVEVG